MVSTAGLEAGPVIAPVSSAATADDRARQAEIDAARTRELEEERHEASARVLDLPRIDDALVAKRQTALIRNYVRAVLIEPVVGRLYAVGMGLARFDTPTAMGNVVSVPAPAAVQVTALKALVAIGLPNGLGLDDADDTILPGVIALGALELRNVQQRAAEDRAKLAMEAFSDDTLDTMPERIAAGEFEAVHVQEGIGSPTVMSDDIAPPPPSTEPTPEQIILAKRRARGTVPR